MIEEGFVEPAALDLDDLDSVEVSGAFQSKMFMRFITWKKTTIFYPFMSLYTRKCSFYLVKMQFHNFAFLNNIRKNI